MSIRNQVGREVRVAFSKRAQPVWFRIVKWIVAIAVSVTLWRTTYFWWWLGGAFTLGLTLHFTWRWKTGGWTKAWGGWDDVDTADGDQ
jgi:hypothetical protein